jgi:CRISPR-associated protein (Cas_Csy4)
MDHSHYLDIMIRTPAIAHDLFARLVMVTHRHIKRGDALAIAWPDWSDTRGEFGFLFRVFGAAQALDRYRQAIQPLQDAALVRVFPSAAVPMVTKQVVFFRDRSLDRFSPSAARRLARRASQRGEVYSPKPAPIQQNHYLLLQSASGDNTHFNLFVHKKKNGIGFAGGHQYGLGYAVPDF